MSDNIRPNDTVELGTYNRLGFLLENSIAIMIAEGEDEGTALECTLFPHVHGPDKRDCLISSLRVSLPNNGGEVVIDADSLMLALSSVQKEYNEMIKPE